MSNMIVSQLDRSLLVKPLFDACRYGYQMSTGSLPKWSASDILDSARMDCVEQMDNSQPEFLASEEISELCSTLGTRPDHSQRSDLCELPAESITIKHTYSPSVYETPSMGAVSASNIPWTKSAQAHIKAHDTEHIASPLDSRTEPYTSGTIHSSVLDRAIELPADTCAKTLRDSHFVTNDQRRHYHERPPVIVVELPAEEGLALRVVDGGEKRQPPCEGSQHNTTRRYSAPARAAPKSPSIASSSSESDLSIKDGKLRPWKGKARLPQIRSIVWDEIPDEEVDAFCSRFNIGLEDDNATISECDASSKARLQKEATPCGGSDQVDLVFLPQHDPLRQRIRNHSLDSPRRGALNHQSSAGRYRSPPTSHSSADLAASHQRDAVELPASMTPEAEIATQKRVEEMGKAILASESRLRDEWHVLKKRFDEETARIASALQARKRQEEVEAAESARKLQAEVELREARERKEKLERQVHEREQERARLEAERIRIAEERARIRIECLVCGDEKGIDDYPAQASTARCQHESKICTECLDSWVASSLKDHGLDGIKCPQCPEKLGYEDVQHAASPATFEAYDKAATLSALSSLPEFAWCLKPGCGYGQLNVASNNYMECMSCGYKQCLKHQQPWHTGESCAKFDERTNRRSKDEEMTLAMLDAVSKVCPGENCGWRIQKIDGCDHITCKSCRHEFCWQCLASHKEIRRVGNTAHQKSCRFHSDNLELAWPFNRHA